MQKQWGGEDNQKGQEEWRSFSAYNMGRWKGRVLHLSPETGQYVSPFSVSHLVDVMALGEGAQSATMRTMTGADAAPRMSETVITVNEDFDAAEDGSYSRDATFSEVPDVDGAFRFCIEMCLQLSGDERVRFQALYDFESKLSRIVLYEEYRVVSTGAQRLIGIKLESDDKPTPEIRSPLTMLSLIGEFRGEAIGRRSPRLGGGSLKMNTRSGIQWDGKTLRREFELVDGRLRSDRQVMFGEMGGTVEDVISLGEGYKILLLPSGCWCCIPQRLEPEVSSPDMDRPPSPAPPGVAPESDKEKLEAMMSGFDLTDDVVGVKPFTAEFGCYIKEGVRKRMVRMYNTDGTLLTTTTVDEKRAEESSGDSATSKSSYDEFAD